MPYPRRGNRRRYAVALGQGFSDALLRLLISVRTTGEVLVCSDGTADVRTLAQAYALVPKGGMIWLLPGHRERC